jgi:hypothetical protein
MRLSIFVALGFALSACTPSISSEQAPLASSEQVPSPNLPTATIVAEAVQSSTAGPPTPAEPTPTRIPLPRVEPPNVESEYCKWPTFVLSISDTQGLDEGQIAAKLLSLHLDYFNSSQAPDWCRIDGYQIEKVFELDPDDVEPLIPKGDFMQVVQYSFKLIQTPNYWMSFPGEIDQQNWLHTSQALSIFIYESDGVYKMKFARP